MQIAGAGHMLLQEAPQVITNAIDAVIWGNSCDASQGGHNTAQPMPDAAGPHHDRDCGAAAAEARGHRRR
ncbi:hypothetical protein I552_0473 [Mycobacterium xenopi 3993]|nr:hypothetical protein I552_0473 [Mycobacterium xenopi 3993]